MAASWQQFAEEVSSAFATTVDSLWQKLASLERKMPAQSSTHNSSPLLRHLERRIALLREQNVCLQREVACSLSCPTSPSESPSIAREPHMSKAEAKILRGLCRLVSRGARKSRRSDGIRALLNTTI